MLAILEELSARRPDSVAFAHQRSLAIVRIGDIEYPSDVNAAGARFREALRQQQALVDAGADDPSLLDDLGWSFSRMAHLSSLENRTDEALEWTRRQLEITMLVRGFDATAPRSYWSESFAHRQAAHILKNMPRRVEYERHMTRCLQVAEHLLTLAPDNRVFLHHFAMQAMELALEVELPAGRIDVARSLAEKARNSMARIARLEPDSMLTRIDHATIEGGWRALLERIGDPADP